MIYASICSGIEAASVAWEPLGWRPAWFAEIDKFPSAVLAHRFPNVPNIGDFTNAGKIPGDKIDLLVGGTPCQSFSVAGKRTGFDDDRGKLVHAYGDLVRRLRPRWIVWENVPGVITGAENKRGFLRFVDSLTESGYGVAWRILDAQYVRVDGFPRAVPQRRRRVFLVGHLGDWRPPCGVLFEPESVRGDDPPERRAGKDLAEGIGGDRGSVYAILGNVIGRQPGNGGNGVGGKADVSYTQTARDEHAVAFCINRQALNRNKDTGGMHGKIHMQDSTFTIDTNGPHAVAFTTGPHGAEYPVDVAPTLDTRCKDGPIRNQIGCGVVMPSTAVANHAVVRRLTEVECERLQGFPDGWTDIPWRGGKTKWELGEAPFSTVEIDGDGDVKQAPKGHRYKALGNSMAVNCMRWIGQRIQQWEDLQNE